MKYRLTPRQARFVKHYAISGNAKQSAIKAGYKPSRAQETGYRLVTYGHVSAAIAAARAKAEQKLEITLEKTLSRLATIAYGGGGDEFKGSDQVRALARLLDYQKPATEHAEELPAQGIPGDVSEESVNAVIDACIIERNAECG